METSRDLCVRPKILVVDDIFANLTAIEILLKDIDVEVITAQSGNEGLAKALVEDIVLILLDINMPVMDGFEVAALLNDLEETQDIPIIFLTAYHQGEANLLKGYDCGAIDYIIKPINPDILLSKIQIFINMWQLRHGLQQEIQRRLIAEKEIEFLAQNDPLTTLPNRRQIHIEMDIVLERAKRQNSHFAVLFLDLDGFKKINDELGHEAGDTFLIEVANRFKTHIRSFDLIARYGGDEFVIVLSDIKRSLELSNKLAMLTALAVQPVYWNSNEMIGGVSIGVSIYPDHGQDSAGLIQCADHAMYLAKGAGRNTYRFYTQALNDALQRKILLESHLRKAMEYKELEVYYQPIVDIKDGDYISAEALLRWSDETLGQVSPTEFIPIAETSGLIHQLGIWVLSQAVEVMQQHPKICIAINVSALQFNNDTLVNTIANYIHQEVIQPYQIVVEITEGILLENTTEVQQRLEKVKSMGISLSIDDFGTGYSALGYLKRCPVNKLKIDRSFINETPADSENVALVKSIIAMAHTLGMQVVAEGVETKEQWEFLQEQGCDSAQGYYFSEPLNKTTFGQCVAQHCS